MRYLSLLLVFSSIVFGQVTPVRTESRDYRGNGTPASGCATATDVGKRYYRMNAEAANATEYNCANTAVGVYSWELVAGSAGGGGTINSGATNTIPKYTAATTIDDSLLSDDGTTLSYIGTGGISATGSIAAGVGGTAAGAFDFGQGTAPTAGTNSVTLYGHSAITSYIMRLPSAAGSGIYRGDNTAGVVVMTQAELSGDATTSGSNTVTVVKINGVTVTGTPSAGYAPTATSSSAATWQASVRPIASGTKALDTDAIASEACDTMTATATGALTTDVIEYTTNADTTGVTGYAPVVGGKLFITVWPTADTVNIKVCNPTALSITPGAVSLNWHIKR